jgi:hypothetical protein
LGPAIVSLLKRRRKRRVGNFMLQTMCTC